MRCRLIIRALVWIALPGAPIVESVALADAGTLGADSGAVTAPSSRPAGDGGVADGRRDGAPDAVRLPAWAPRLTATVQPAQALIGDPVKVTITVRHRPGVSVNLPLQLELGKFHELSREDNAKELKARGAMGDLERVFVLKVAAYELGELTLPAIEVTALGPNGELCTLTTEPIPLRIQSVLRNEPNPKPKGLEPPISVFQRTWLLLYVLIAVGGAGLVAVATLIISRRLRARRAAARPPAPPEPAHLLALRRLAAINLEELLARGELKPLYLLFSEIVRQYLGGRWQVDALEMTTTEINEALCQKHLPPELLRRFEVFFNGCDLVKFAKFVPTDEDARAARAEAEALVRDTALPDRPAVQSPPADSGAEASGVSHAG